MRERVRRRAAAFARREATREGRVDNARSLLGSTATGFQVARLARDVVERARLFRHQQSTLRSWARRVVPPALPDRPPIVRPTPDERRAALAGHDRQTVNLLREMQARHAAERQAEQADRRALQQEAGANWRRLALKDMAASVLAKWAGYLTGHWLATHATANDNEPGHTPPRMGPRPGGPRPV